MPDQFEALCEAIVADYVLTSQAVKEKSFAKPSKAMPFRINPMTGNSRWPEFAGLLSTAVGCALILVGLR